jgi:Sulfotransferase family
MTTVTGETFSVADMLAAACAEAGLVDFGTEEFREALTRLVDSTNNEALLSELGATAFKADMHRMLVVRLRFAEALKRNPEILDEDVSDPIVILGMPRTGTTKLQRMLSADPEVQRLDYWRLYNPVPFDDAVTGNAFVNEDPRIDAARRVISAMAQLMPKWMDSHPTSAEEVDEDVFLQIYTFKSQILYMFRPVPSYQAWMEQQDFRDTYQFEKKMLQYLQWQDGGKRGRPWILKTPVHMRTTHIVREVFPKATLVFTHRDMHQVIPSHCRLMESTRNIYMVKTDLHEIGRVCLSDFKTEMQKHLELRDRMGAQLNILDVYYDELKVDALGVIRKIYRHAGRELTPRREQVMRDWEQAHPLHYAGSYSYKIEDYGLTNDDIDQAFAGYNKRFLQGERK